MKRLTGLLCVLLIAGAVLSGYAAENNDDVKYNYKLSFENESEFTNKYGWASAHPSNPDFPDSMKPTASVVSDGKYGSAYQVINPFFYCDAYYGITWRLELKQIITPMPGEASERLIDYMKEVRSVNYWVKLPYSEAVEKNVAANTRRTRMTLETLISAPTPDDLDHTKSASFRADVRLKNTDEWQYVQVPISCFMYGGLPITDYFDLIQKFRYLDIEAFNDKSFFGELPAKPVLNPDGSIETPAPSWNDRSKDVPILYDEIVFDRSTEEKPAYTKPSPGEEENLMNANLGSVYVKGEEVADLRINMKNEITIPVPPSITELAEGDVECIPEIYTVLSDLSATKPIISTGVEQIRVGAACELTAPKNIPGTGELTIIAGDGITCNRYELNFVHREGVYTGTPSVMGLNTDGSLPNGSVDISVPIYNAESGTADAVIAATVTDPETGAVKSAVVKKIENITNFEAKSAELKINTVEGCVMKLFVFDNIQTLHLAAEPFVFGDAR